MIIDTFLLFSALNNNTLPFFNSLNKTDYSNSSSYSANYINCNDKLQKNVDLIKDFSKLEDNWDDNGAIKIQNNIINSALSALYLLKIQPDVFPTGRNSIQFEYEKANGDYLEFEFFEDHITMYSIISDNEFEKNVASTELDKMVVDFYARI